MINSKFQRIILLVILAYEGIGGLLGGILLVAAPDGRYMQMPVSIMHGNFPDFLVPGLILTALGMLSVAAFIAVFRKQKIDWLLALFAMGGYMIWFTAEILLVGTHWLQIMWGLPVILGFFLTLPLLPRFHQKVLA